MRIQTLLIATLFMFLSGLNLNAQKLDPAYEKIAPFLKEGTIVLAHIDFGQLDLDAFGKKLKPHFDKTAEIIGENSAQPMNAQMKAEAKKDIEDAYDSMIAAIKEPLESIKAAGIKEVYVMVVMEMMQEYPVILAIPGKPNLGSPLKDQIVPMGSSGGMSFYGIDGATPDPEDGFNTFMGMKAVDNPKFNAAFVLQSKSPIRVAFVPNAGLKLLAMMGMAASIAQSPVDVDGDALGSAIENLESISLGVNPNMLRLNLAFNMNSAEAAKAFDKFLNNSLDEAMKGDGDPMAAMMLQAFKPVILDFMPKARDNYLLLSVDEAKFEKYQEMLIGTMLPAVQAAREAARRMQCSNNIKQLGIALHNYHDVHGAFPPLYTVDAAGKPLHSWRVLLLPYLEQQALYDSIKLDEPWDSEHNSQFHNQVISTFVCPSNTLAKKGADCCYVVIAGEALVPAQKAGEIKGIGFGAITDGTSNTFGVLELKQPFCWMDPTKDITLPEAQRGINGNNAKLGSFHTGGFNAGMLDGSVRFFSNDLEPALIRAMGTKDGGDLNQ